MFQSFSPNMLKTYKLCPRKFYYKYIKNITMPTNDEIFELGKNIHALASYYLRKENIYEMEAALNAKEKEIWEYLKTIKYFSYETINTEYNLSVKINDTFFGGRVDAIVKHENKYYILDYKTGSIPKNSKYDYQTIIYLLAINDFFKTDNISFVYIDLKNRSEVNIDFSTELKNEYIKILNDIANEINNNEYKKIATDCKCEYSIICY